MMTDHEFYAVISIVMAIITLPIAAIVASMSGDERRYYVPVVVVPAIPAIAFGLMSQGILLYETDGESSIALARMLGYTIIFPTMAGYIGVVGGLDRRKIWTLAGCMFLVVVGITLRWVPNEAVAAGAPLLTIVALIAAAYLLLGPYNRETADQTGERRLLFGKLRNLLLIMWLFYVLGSLFIDSGMGFMDRFTSVFFANYLDVVAVTMFSAIILRSRDAVRQVADDSSSEPPETGDGSVDRDEAAVAAG